MIRLAQRLKALVLSKGADLLIRDAAAANHLRILGGEDDLTLGGSFEGEERARPSRVRFSALTDGLFRPLSISEMVEIATPSRARCYRSLASRKWRSRTPT